MEQHLVLLVHITPEVLAGKFRGNGIGVSRFSKVLLCDGSDRAVWAFPVLESYTLTRSWGREPKRGGLQPGSVRWVQDMHGILRPTMRLPRMRWSGQIVRCAALATGILAFCAPVGAAGSVEEGLKLANMHCSRCHVVSESNRMGGIGSTPSFRLLVTAFKDWRARFETFYARRPHPAFLSIEGRGRLRTDLPPNAHPVTLPARAIDDLVALAEEIKAGAANAGTNKTAE